MIDRVRREFSAKDIAEIANTYHRWRDKPEILKKKGLALYADEPGFCNAVKIDVVREHGYVLTPGRYVGAAPQQDHGVPLTERFAQLREQLKANFAEGRYLEQKIITLLEGLPR